MGTHAQRTRWRRRETNCSGSFMGAWAGRPQPVSPRWGGGADFEAFVHMIAQDESRTVAATRGPRTESTNPFVQRRWPSTSRPSLSGAQPSASLQVTLGMVQSHNFFLHLWVFRPHGSKFTRYRQWTEKWTWKICERWWNRASTDPSGTHVPIPRR